MVHTFRSSADPRHGLADGAKTHQRSLGYQTCARHTTRERATSPSYDINWSDQLSLAEEYREDMHTHKEGCSFGEEERRGVG